MPCGPQPEGSPSGSTPTTAPPTSHLHPTMHFQSHLPTPPHASAGQCYGRWNKGKRTGLVSSEAVAGATDVRSSGTSRQMSPVDQETAATSPADDPMGLCSPRRPLRPRYLQPPSRALLQRIFLQRGLHGGQGRGSPSVGGRSAVVPFATYGACTFARATQSGTSTGRRSNTSRPKSTSSTNPMWVMSTMRQRYERPMFHHVLYESTIR